MNETLSRKTLAEFLDEAEQRGYERCQRDVVAYLRDGSHIFDELSEEIEQGLHVGAAEKGGE